MQLSIRVLHLSQAIFLWAPRWSKINCDGIAMVVPSQLKNKLAVETANGPVMSEHTATNDNGRRVLGHNRTIRRFDSELVLPANLPSQLILDHRGAHKKIA